MWAKQCKAIKIKASRKQKIKNISGNKETEGSITEENEKQVYIKEAKNKKT
jgi:hypothetical protein